LLNEVVARDFGFQVFVDHHVATIDRLFTADTPNAPVCAGSRDAETGCSDTRSHGNASFLPAQPHRDRDRVQ
jgi:hypothetical protein